MNKIDQQHEGLSGNVHKALMLWNEFIPADRIMGADEAACRYGHTTSTSFPNLSGAIQPLSTHEISRILAIAQEFRVPVYPVSTGHNWGYGAAAPCISACVILDLSRMNRIPHFDEELGTITVQPGVTQQILRNFLDARNADFLVPVHGGGPGCSIIGNALERGYGITPHADHFGSLIALEAVLPDGRVYHSVLRGLAGAAADSLFKWGIGPYLDGLFSQGNFGVVTEATFSLARHPERVEGFYFWIARDEQLEEAVDAVRGLVRSLGSVVGSINLMNRRRMLSMSVPYPKNEVPSGGIMPDSVVDALARQLSLPAWMGIGALYGTKEIVRAARKTIRHQLRSCAQRIVFLTPNKSKRLLRISSLLPAACRSRLFATLFNLNEGLKVVSGYPSEIALRIPYWKTGSLPAAGQPVDPAKDGCGLLWYTPLIPMKASSVRDYVRIVEYVCRDYRIEPLITLTSISERCFDSSVPLLFDKNDPDESERVEKAYRTLFGTGRSLGYLPYRYATEHMPMILDEKITAWDVVHRLKQALDPGGIMSPGRYDLNIRSGDQSRDVRQDVIC
jgi:4-cresol dehydrogenase (hydroxylating)